MARRPRDVLGPGDLWLARDVGAAIVTVGIMATTIGLLLPWALARVGKDPAFGFGPVAPIIRNVPGPPVEFTIVPWLFP
jgi:magnesium transporter